MLCEECTVEELRKIADWMENESSNHFMIEADAVREAAEMIERKEKPWKS